MTLEYRRSDGGLVIEIFGKPALVNFAKLSESKELFKIITKNIKGMGTYPAFLVLEDSVLTISSDIKITLFKDDYIKVI